MMDFGYPQYTEAKILSEFIKTNAYRMETSQRPPMAVTNAVSWRSEGINYKKNEVFSHPFHSFFCQSNLFFLIE
jgi:AP-1 complex subunit mu